MQEASLQYHPSHRSLQIGCLMLFGIAKFGRKGQRNICSYVGSISHLFGLLEMQMQQDVGKPKHKQVIAAILLGLKENQSNCHAAMQLFFQLGFIWLASSGMDIMNED